MKSTPPRKRRRRRGVHRRRLSRGQIRRRLGLDIAEKYRYRHSKEFWPTYGERRSGKTVDMLVTVMERLQEGRPVTIIGHNAAYAHQLALQAREYALDLGLDPNLIRELSQQAYLFPAQLIGRRDAVLYDHTCHER